MQKADIRVVIDTNIWVSFLIGKMLSDLLEAVLSNRIKVLFCEKLFNELTKVLKRPKFSKYFSYEKIKEFIAIIDSTAERIEPMQHFKVCRDEKDNFLLDLCVAGKADYLITGDQDLLILTLFHGTKIINYQYFQEFLKKF